MFLWLTLLIIIVCCPLSEHHDYFLTSHRIIEDITKRFKTKLANKLKLNEATLKNVEKYPNLLIKPVEKDEQEQLCRVSLWVTFIQFDVTFRLSAKSLKIRILIISRHAIQIQALK